MQECLHGYIMPSCALCRAASEALSHEVRGDYEDGTSPEGRRAYLDSLDTPDLNDRLTEAENMIEACERDAEEATDELWAARADFPHADLADQRELTPGARRRYAVLLDAADTAERAQRALQAAKGRHDALLREWEAATGPLMPPFLGAEHEHDDRAGPRDQPARQPGRGAGAPAAQSGPLPWPAPRPLPVS